MSKTRSFTIRAKTVAVSNPVASNSIIVVSIDDPYIDDLLGEIHEDDLIEYAQRNFALEDVYPESDLEKWAEANGWIKQ